MPFEYLDDEAIADIAFRATGKDIDQLFHDSAMAVCQLQTDIEILDESIKKEIQLEANDFERLLYMLLDEIIFLKDADLFFPKKVSLKVKKMNGKCQVSGYFQGCTFDYTKHPMGNDIKAITLHDFYVKEIPEGWESYVLIDI